jgi:hypothetical protein
MKIPRILLTIFGFVLTLGVLPLTLLAVGYQQIAPGFTGEFTQHFGSIEVSYIQMAKFITASLPNFSWQPLWYFGYPMHVLYTPLVPFFEYFAHLFVGWSFGHAYRVLTAGSFVIGLVTLYLFARSLYKNSVAGYITALCYGLLPSLIALLFPEVAKDRFALDLIEPRRFTILVRWGEGPHIVSLVFLPLAALFWLSFLRKGNKFSLFAGAFFTALVALTNSVGAWGFLLLGFSLFIGELVEQTPLWRTHLKRAVIFGLFSFGFAAFWFNPLFLSTFFREGGGSLGYWRDAFPWGWIVAGGIFAVFFFISKKLLAKFSGVSASVLYFILMFGLVYTYYASGSDHIELVPQVLRLTTEVDMAAALLAGGVVALVGLLVLRFKQIFFYIAMSLVLVVLIPFYTIQQQLVAEIPRFSKPSSPEAILSRPEYEVAKEVETLVQGDERAFLPGNYAFYLNYFTNVPQLRGALFQSAVHPWAEHIYYQMVNGKDSEIALSWLKIANISTLVYSHNLNRELFLDYKIDKDKFDQVLELVEEKNTDYYYKVPLKDNSLAKEVPETILAVKTPKNAIDKQPILEYVENMEAGTKPLVFKEKENGRFQISGEVDKDNLILVQQTYVPGWQAKDNLGRSLDIKKDPLGFITIKPKQTGTQDIMLTYRPTWRVWSGWLISGLAIVGALFVLIRFKNPIFTNVVPLKKESEIDNE